MAEQERENQGDVATVPVATVTPNTDAFTVFLERHRRALPAKRGAKRFNSGEHIWLGDQGAANARAGIERELGLKVPEDVFASIRRRQGADELRYGEIVALSGDFYESPEALYDERPARLPWLWEDNDLSDLRELFAEELRWISDPRSKRGRPPYPDENIRMAWNAKAYVELALRNTAHFGWHNLVCYCHHHAEALRLAVAANGRENETFRHALYLNGFADHFLTDGFSAGHIRIPRAQILTWAATAGLNDRIAGALSKLLHDQDGHVDAASVHGQVDDYTRPWEQGLPVENAAGTRWSARCDGQLFLDQAATEAPAVQQPVTAVAASVRELLLAWLRHEVPQGVYDATGYVPFPRPGSPALIDKFPARLPDATIEALFKGVGWYAKVPWLSGLERGHIRQLLEALPRIMEEFRRDVARAIEGEPALGSRIAAPYLAAYRQVA